MKSLVVKLTVFIVLLSVTGCVSYKPNEYDVKNEVFKNYEKNYSLHIRKDYKLVDHETAKEIMREDFNYIDDSIIFYNEKLNTILLIVSAGRFKGAFPADIERAYNFVVWDLNNQFKGSEVKRYKDGVVCKCKHDFSRRYSHGVIKSRLYDISKNSSTKSFFMIGLGGTELKDITVQNDFSNVYKSLKLTAFDDDERVLKK